MSNEWNRSAPGRAAMRDRGRLWKRKRAAENRAAITALKSRPCADCGGTFDPVCMDFDHRPGETKVAAVSSMVSRFPLDAVLAEAAKCDLVCANCHRLRTHRERDHRSLVMRTTPQVIAAGEPTQLALLPKEAGHG